MAAKKQKAHLEPVKEWMNLEREDKGHCLRDWYVQATILAGATSVQELMAVTYLSQFEDLNGEFATRPVYAPDFQVGVVPYSSELLELYNDVASRMGLDPRGNGQDLRVQTEMNTQANIDDLVQRGAQLSRLYQENKRNLERFKDDDRSLFRTVRGCHFRDKSLVDNLAYLTDPITARSED
jgi:hypothetical protein